MFLRRLIDLSTVVSSNNFFVTINAEARLDLKWWQDFLPEWNGVEIIQEHPVSSHDSWVMSEWEAEWGAQHINIRELFAIWVAVVTWGDQLRNLQIQILTDSLSMVQVWSTGSSKDKVVMRILRALFLFCAKRNINILMKHIPGTTNLAADFLSRLQVRKFKEVHPSADELPTPVPPQVWNI